MPPRKAGYWSQPDTDFGGLLARSRVASPSVLLIRRLAGRRAAEQSVISGPTLGPGGRRSGYRRRKAKPQDLIEGSVQMFGTPEERKQYYETQELLEEMGM